MFNLEDTDDELKQRLLSLDSLSTCEATFTTLTVSLICKQLTCTLGRFRQFVPGNFVGTADIFSLRCHNPSQVRFRSPVRTLQSQLTYNSSPSSNNRDGFFERTLVESAKTVGPRIFHTGDIIYGAGEPGIHQDIVDMDEAYNALVRIKAEGGPASFSYKNYNQPVRATRQRLLSAAKELGMVCVPEGVRGF